MDSKYKDSYRAITIFLHKENDKDIIDYLGKHPKKNIEQLIKEKQKADKV